MISELHSRDISANVLLSPAYSLDTEVAPSIRYESSLIPQKIRNVRMARHDTRPEQILIDERMFLAVYYQSACIIDNRMKRVQVVKTKVSSAITPHSGVSH